MQKNSCKMRKTWSTVDMKKCHYLHKKILNLMSMQFGNFEFTPRQELTCHYMMKSWQSLGRTSPSPPTATSRPTPSQLLLLLSATVSTHCLVDHIDNYDNNKNNNSHLTIVTTTPTTPVSTETAV